MSEQIKPTGHWLTRTST